MSVKFSARNSGAGNGRANFMGAWIFWLFLQENPHTHKILLLGGILGFFRRGGWKCQFYFYERGDFSDRCTFFLGVPKPGCFKPGCIQFLCGSAQSLFCALLRSFALFCGLAFTLFFAKFAFFSAHLRVSASDSLRLERPRLGTADLDSLGGGAGTPRRLLRRLCSLSEPGQLLTLVAPSTG